MAKKSFKDLAKTARQKEVSRAVGFVGFVKSSVLMRAVNLIPTRMRWMVPFLSEYLKEIPTPSVEEMKGKVSDRLKGKPGVETDREQLPPELQETAGLYIPQQVKLYYQHYRCERGNPLECPWTQKTLDEQPKAKYCLRCGFPTLLAPETQIRGSRGVYEIEKFVRSRGMGRIYRAIRLSDRQAVAIKEYLLPKQYFNSLEERQTKEMFMRLAGLSLADGRVQDFRLVDPIEAIADPKEERCYLVTPAHLDMAPTLATYLAETGALTNAQVWQILDRILQSLEFLHTQKFRLRSGLIQEGIVHGNINLDSLIILPDWQGFFIYLCDLALWEYRFIPPASQIPTSSPLKDLADLGKVAFYLLAGRTIDPETNEHLDPRLDRNWPADVTPELKQFIERAIGVNAVAFPNVEAARIALLKIPFQRGIVSTQAREEIEAVEEISSEKEAKKGDRQWQKRLPFLILGTAGLLLLFLLIWVAIARSKQKNIEEENGVICCIEEVAGVPDGNFTYTGEKQGNWSYILTQENLIQKGKSLDESLAEDKPKFELNYRPKESISQAIGAIRSKQADFGIMSLPSVEKFAKDSLYTELGYQTIAYDGLVVFVSFSYARRDRSIPAALNGSLTIEQLQKLYTGKIRNWQELGGPNLPVRLYIPADGEAIEIFKQRVLPEESAQISFDRLRQSQQDSTSFTIEEPQLLQLPTFEILRSIIRDFEGEEIGSIGFGTLSKIFGQCSIYPLAISQGDRAPISPLVERDNEGITPETDLCNNKGSYRYNVNAFVRGQYPLAYPVVVVYPRDNSRVPAGPKFAEMLSTVEAQRLLSQTGLIPVQPLPE
ncbi:substrate-binding domain-containing protein [Oxynema aestuarii]|uniref:Phosphate ABC transporter substrate-binding protein n=1 Tax=Oxynema aestuarii AP17 TaxID=2064643 RepID=A0A6H1TXD7_9CYAN|nr:substrate-binding domain-containing protein [Oxynema aestuarii]QIZ70433.1 phosphate ABC transporter substrate-binding protein [Oxynema aestuarii AP17]